MKLLTGFEACGLPVKDFALGVSVVTVDGASIVQILKGVDLQDVNEETTPTCGSVH